MKLATSGAAVAHQVELTTSPAGPRYEMLAPIATGALGTTYRARHLQQDAQVAVTVLPGTVGQDRALLDRLQAAVRAAAGLRHEHIVPVIELDEEADGFRLVEALVEAEPLTTVLREGPLAAVDALHVARQLADALGYAHERGALHGALAPDAVLLVRAVPPRALLAGFTTAAVVAPALPYVAPECLRREAADARTDVFGLGLLLFELFEGRPFFSGTEDVRRVLLEEKTPLVPRFSRLAPSGVSALIARALRRAPGDRQQTMNQMRGEIDDCLRRLGEQPAAQSVAVPSRRRAVLVVDDTVDDEADDAPAAVAAKATGATTAPARKAPRGPTREASFPAYVVVGAGGRRPAIPNPGKVLIAVLLLALGWPLWRASWTKPHDVVRPAPPASHPAAEAVPAVAPAVAHEPPARVVASAPGPEAAAAELRPARKLPPRITARQPKGNMVDVTEGRTAEFSVRATERAADDLLSYAWFVDGRKVGRDARWRFTAPLGSSGATHTVAVEISDGSGLKAPRVSWTVDVSARMTEANVHDWLERLGSAWQRRDLATLRLYGIVGDEAAAADVRSRFSRYDGARVTITNARIKTEGRYASVTFDRSDVDKRGKLLRSGTESYELEKRPSGFVGLRAR